MKKRMEELWETWCACMCILSRENAIYMNKICLRITLPRILIYIFIHLFIFFFFKNNLKILDKYRR